MILEGTVISCIQKNTATRISISGGVTAVIQGAFSLPPGVRIRLQGRLVHSKKGRKYLFAENYELLDRKAQRISIPESALPAENLIRVLYAAGKKSTAKRLCCLPAKKIIEIKENPWLLYIKGYTDFQTAELVAEGMLAEKNHPGRIEAAVLHVLKAHYSKGGQFLTVDELKEEVKNLISVDLDESSPFGKSAVIENNRVWLRSVFYTRKNTLKMVKSVYPFIKLDVNDPVISELLSHRYVVLTGPAGSGKTTILRKLKSLPVSVAYTALTGKAACLFDEGKTLHSLLGFGRGGFSVKNLPFDIVVVDEASMLDWYTAHALFRAAKGHVILSGDEKQLEPVKGGSVFKELMSVLPTVSLQNQYRFGKEHEIITIRKTSPQDALSSVLALSVYLSSKGESLQVLSPVKDGLLGTISLNSVLREKLNRSGRKISEKFRTGDRVIVTRNCYDREEPAYNGQIGLIVDADASWIYVRLSNKITLNFRESEIELAYALTVHKAQGSEFENTIVVLPLSTHSSFIDEKLREVALTRARKKCFVIEV